MAASIAYSNINYDEFVGHFIKAYEPSSTIAKTIYSDANKTQGYAKIQVDNEGFLGSGGARFIPFIEGYFDLYLFPDEQSADSNDTSSAIRLADNITAESLVENAQNAGYDNTGLSQTLKSSEVEVYYDTKDTPAPVIPAVFKHPDMTSLDTAIQRALLDAGIGGNGAVQLGDGIFTLRDLDDNTAYVKEKVRFVRADYPELDALMGPYIPESYDFSNGSYSTLLLPDTGDPTTNMNNSFVNRQVLEWAGAIVVVKHDQLVLINPQTHLLLNTISVPAAYSGYFFQGAVAASNGKMYVMLSILSGTGSAVQFVLISYDTFVSGHTFEMDTSTLYDLGYTASEVGRYGIIYDDQTQSVFMCTSGAVNAASPSEIAGIIRYDIATSDWTITALQAPASYNTSSDTLNHSFFWDPNSQQIRFVVHNASNAVYSQNLPPRVVSINLGRLNSTPSTKLTVALEDKDVVRLPDVDKIFGFERAPSADSVLYNQRSARVVFDADTNELYIFSNYPEATGTSAIVDQRIMGLRYDLENNAIRNAITSRDFFAAGIGSALGDNTIPDGTVGGSYDNNKVFENVFITIENKAYFPVVLQTEFGARRLTFINFDDNNVFDILEGYSYTTNPDGQGLNSDIFSGHILKYADDTFMWFDARGSGLEAALTFRRYTLTDDVFTNTTRPAPILNAVPPMMGYILAK